MGDRNSGMLEAEIFADLEAELSAADDHYSPELLRAKVKNALREVRRSRNYPSYYTETQIETDMEGFYSNIRNIALFDYNATGGEYEASHSENGISRSYIDRDKLFSGILPISFF